MAATLKGGGSQPIKRHGGKGYLADWIIGLMPPHTRYVEAFFGGGAVLFRKPCEGVAEFANDLDGELMNFWAVMADPTDFAAFSRTIEATPLCDCEWARAAAPWFPQETRSDRAARFFIRMRQSRQGLGKDYCTPTGRTRRGMNEQVSAWLSAVEGLADAHARLKRVEIWNRPAVDVIRKLDSPDTLFYCDPPYLHSTRSSVGEYGPNEMSEADHTALLGVLSGIEGRFMLSGYHSKLYDDYAATAGWRTAEREIDNKASSAKKKEKRYEVVWMNY